MTSIPPAANASGSRGPNDVPLEFRHPRRYWSDTIVDPYFLREPSSNTTPAMSETAPTAGLRTMVWGFLKSIVKKPASADSRVKNVKLGRVYLLILAVRP